MPQYAYKGRDKEGRFRSGERFAQTIDKLNMELINEGISPLSISPSVTSQPYWHKIYDWFQGRTVRLEELAIFARQMQLLHQAGVPIVTAILQLADYMRSPSIVQALRGVVEHLEKGQDLATSVQQFPEVFSPLMVNIIRIGERTGHLNEAFAHLHKYLTFEASSIKQLKSAFRYPMFVLVSVAFAVLIINIFVIPNFARFYTGTNTALPWQTELLIGTSNFLVNNGFYLLIITGILGFFAHRYFQSPKGKYKFHKFLFKLPVVGRLLRRIILIRFSQTMAIVLNAGIPITQGLDLVKEVLQNSYVTRQIIEAKEMIERGNSFTQSIAKVDLFSTMELQILAVGEKNGELGPALSYIGDFHGQEIEYDLKHMNDIIGPVLIAGVSVLILIIALGVYLPIWNMVSSGK